MFVTRLIGPGILVALMFGAEPVRAQEAADCRIEAYCIEDQFLRIQLEDIRFRDSIVNVALKYINPDVGDMVLSKYGIFLIATSANGERIEISSNRVQNFLGQNAIRKDAYSLKFNEPVGDEVDLIFVFENPDSSYAFLGLAKADFQGVPQ